MNILEQLQQLNITPEEIECVLDNSEHTVESYDKMMKSFRTALESFENLKDNVLVDIETHINIPEIEKAYDEYQQKFTQKAECLRGFIEKLKLLKEIL